MMIDPAIYNGALASTRIAELPPENPEEPPKEEPRKSEPWKPGPDGLAATDGGLTSSEEFFNLEQQRKSPYDYQQVQAEMVHDARHRGETTLDLYNIGNTLKETAAGASGSYDWSRLVGSTFDTKNRLATLEDILASLAIPDGSYRYDFRQESFTVEHKVRTFMIYDLTGEDGKRYLLVRSAQLEGDGSRIEGTEAFNLGDHDVTREQAEPEGPARTWSSRNRLYVFEESTDKARGDRSPTLRLHIRSYEAAFPEDVFPQSSFVDSTGYVGNELRALGFDPAPSKVPTGSARVIRPTLGA
jgi:hypothetical protein